VADATLATGGYEEAYTNFWIAWRARCLTGNHGAFSAQWGPVIDHQLTRYYSALRAWGVEFLDLDARADAPATSLTPLAEDARARVYALRGALGRAYTVPVVLAAPGATEVARAMAHPMFQPAEVAITTDTAAEGSYPGSARCRVRWVEDHPERLVLETEAPDRAFLVVADSHFPGWKAWVDGRPVPIVPVDLLVRGVALDAGRHRVEMRYETPGMRVGVAVTRAALATWFLLALVVAGSVAWRRRGARAVPAA
jgi:hypothetical protein